MYKTLIILMLIALLNVVVVTYCFPVAMLSIDTIAQISVIIVGASLLTVSVLNSLYHVCTKTVDIDK